jgi:hypothetical protein
VVELMGDPLFEERGAIRDDLCSALQADLIGPRAVDETLDEPPLNRYVTGILYPRIEDGLPIDADADAEVDVADDDGDRAPDPAVAMSNVQYPSSAGMTFATAPEIDRLLVTVEAARYEKSDAEPWKRLPVGPVEIEIAVGSPDSKQLEVVPGLDLYYRSRGVRDGARSITVVLLNTLEGEFGNKDETSFFQASFTVRGSATEEAPFVARVERIDIDDEDLRTNALLFRDYPEFAIGHGCSAEWKQVRGERRATTLSATFMPVHDVAIMESNPEIPSSEIGFDDLASAQPDELAAALESFLRGYTEWIEERQTEALTLDERYAETAASHLADCAEARDRIGRGIEVLRDDPHARRAFQLANRAMGDQMERACKDESVDRSIFRWRPFQLAFVLLSLPSIADPELSDRSIAELLWFPTGGGKTEAYLGLFAFTVFHRRITKNGAAGVTAIMRYTLRLLTSQQFERAARVVCACDRIRLQEGDLGDGSISIGLFVGAASTPNTLKDAQESLAKLRAGQQVPTKNPCQLQACPWCDERLGTANYDLPENPKRLRIACRNDACDFAECLPVFVVDEDLYRERPTLVIGTVDKFAALPWKPEVGNLFNLNRPVEPPPDLIIQDELHLISGPLGTMTGLYETAIDILGSNGTPPKVVASTATIRRAKAQSRGLFAREMRQFPPPGLDPGDNWFATLAPTSRIGARRYVGLMAAGVSHATLMIRTYAALLHAAGTHEKGRALDPYWTLIGYFNSLRVLGAARMQVQDDVRDWLELAADGDAQRSIREPAELTSRVDSTEIPGRLREMEVELPSKYVRDVVLATNMISVGVDVDRLGLMVMMGQPQAAAEYIQATSRVGRKHPGLVVALFNAARSRDRSHYEGFTGFHDALYRSVEATSVTPYSPRARDRGLHAVVVALARLQIEGLRENDQASAVPNHAAELAALRELILDRVRTVDADEVAGTAADLDRIIERWSGLAEEHPGLVYASPAGTETALLTAAAPELESGGSFPTMWSLRDVDVESNLFFPAKR